MQAVVASYRNRRYKYKKQHKSWMSCCILPFYHTVDIVNIYFDKLYKQALLTSTSTVKRRACLGSTAYLKVPVLIHY